MAPSRPTTPEEHRRAMLTSVKRPYRLCREAICDGYACGKTPESLTEDDLLGCRRFWLSYAKLLNLKPLAALPNLCELILSWAEHTEWRTLPVLHHLKTVAMTDTSGVRDISPLVNQPALRELYLDLYSPVDVTQIATMTQLRQLTIFYWDEPALDLAPLVTLVNLEELSLGVWHTTDLAFLQQLPNLRQLKLLNADPGQVAELRAALPKCHIAPED